MESSAQVSPILMQSLRRGVDEEVRSRAATLLLSQGDAVVGPLLQALNDPGCDHPFIVELLGRTGSAAATPRLARLLTRGTESRLADACVAVLRTLGFEAVVELSAALAEADCDVVRVAGLLRELRDPWAIPALAHQLYTEKDSVAFEACLSALVSFDREAVSELSVLLTTTRQYPARIAQAAVAIGDPRLAGALGARLRRETDSKTLALCITGLKQLGRDPIPELIEGLNDPKSDPKVRAYVLGKLRDARAVPALTQAVRLHPSGHVRDACLDALKKFGAASVPALCELLAHPRPDTIQVVRALREIGHPSAVPALLHRMARTDDPPVVVAFLGALARLGDAALAETLIERLSDARDGVAPAAAAALATLAERHSFREAVAAVRILRGKLSILRRASEADRFTYRRAIERLEAMAATISTLPMPASPQLREGDLPRPAEQAE